MIWKAASTQNASCCKRFGLTWPKRIRRILTTDTIEEILGVERRIAELEDEIDRLGGDFAALNNQIDYAAIRITLRNTAIPASDTLGERIGELFGAFGAFLRGVAVVLVGVVIYGIPVVIVLAALFWLLLGKVGLLRKLWHLVAGIRK